MTACRSYAPPLTHTELLARLVSQNTSAGRSTTALAEFTCEYARAAGAGVWRQAYADGAKVNLLLARGPLATGNGLLLAGHLDVVPAEEPGWTSPPFQLVCRDDRLYGRGVTDMKGFVALALNALCSTRDEDLRAPLALLLTSDEEVGAIGAQQLLRSPPPDWPSLPSQCIVGEPTGLRVVRMHKGHLKVRITLRGRSAHSGLPHLGENAIERAGAVIRRLSTLAAHWRELRPAHGEHFPDCPHPVLNLGLISGGSAVNIVPDRCTIDLGIRLLPGQSTEQAMREIEFAMQELPRTIRDALETQEVNDNPPLLCPETAPIHQALTAVLGPQPTLGVSYASDAGWLSKSGMQCVLWGPGEMEDAHRPDESIELSQLERAQPLLLQFIDRFCGPASATA